MPWEIKKANNKHCIYKKGEPIPIKGGCFDEKPEAEAKMKALYSAEGDYAIAESYLEEAKRALEPIEEESFFSETSFNGDSDYEADPDAEEFSWQGPIAYEEVLTGDHRIFKTGAISWDAESLPWPYRYQRASTQGHAGCVPIGRVDHIERQEGGVIYGYGVIIPSLNDEAAEYMRLMKANAAGGCSIDGDSAEFDVQDLGEGKTRIEFSSMRLRSVTAVDLPAFHEAQIDLTEGDNEELARKIRRGKLEHLHEITASGDDLTLEAITFAPSEWEIVNWGGETPFCLKPKKLEGGDDIESKLNEPLKCFKTEAEAKTYLTENSPSAAKTIEKERKAEEASLEPLLAAAIPCKPSTKCFLEPTFDGPTPITITENGVLSGYLALFGTCHIGFSGACVTPPRNSSYKYFHTGEIETAEGDLVDVGHLTFNTGHASMTDNAKAAAAHYDHTGTVAADVRVGEDERGIWVVGALRSTLSDEDIRAFRSAPLSGDWRRIAGRLELVSALAVNVPGFPVPRARSLVASGESQALIYTELTETMDDIDTMDAYEEGLRFAQRNRLRSLVEFATETDTIEIPEELTKADVEAKAKALTGSQLKEYLKDIRELLDDPDEGIEGEDKKNLEELYKVGSKALNDKFSMAMEEFHEGGGHDQSSHGGKGGGGGGKKLASSKSGSKTGRVSKLGNKSDYMNRQQTNSKDADMMARRTVKSANRWGAVAIAAAAVATLTLGATFFVGPFATGVAIGSAINMGVRVQQSRRHSKQADALRKEGK